MKQRLLTLLLMAWTCMFLHASDTDPINLVFIGNSITYGANLSDPATQAPPVKVATMVKQQTGRNVYYRNCGLSGSATPGWMPGTNLFSNADNAAKDLQKAHPGVLFFSIMLGTNDTHQGYKTSPETYYSNMKTIIQELLTRHPEAHIIVNYPTWYSPNTHNGAVYLQEGLDRLKSYMPMITRLCELFQKSERPQVWPGDPSVFSFFENQTQYFVAENGNSGVFYLHPNTTGGTKLAEFWTKSIMEHLADLAPLHSEDELLLDKARQTLSSCLTVDRNSLKAANRLLAAGELSTNGTAAAGTNLDNLVDMNPATGFQVDENSTSPDKAPWVQVELKDKPLSQMVMTMQKASTGEGLTPTDVSVLASADGKEWTPVAGLHDMEVGSGYYVSPIISVGENCHYLRLCVNNTASLRLTEGGALAWSLGELQLYSVDVDYAASPYTKVEGLKEACDALKARISECAAALASSALTAEQRTALSQAIAQVTALYKAEDGGQEGDPDVVFTTDLNTGDAYTFNKKEKLLKYSSQIRANSEEKNASTNFSPANLLNAGTDYTNIIWHTAWTGNVLGPEEDNYLQVHFSTKQSSICFTMIGSNWPSTYDTPDHMVIQASNTITDASSWVEVAELPDMIPAELHDVHPAFYTSPRIDLGGEYSNVRFVIKKTVNNRRNSKGNIYVSLARFQVFQAVAVDDPVKQLEVLVDRMMERNATVMAGTQPGCYPQEQVDAFRQVLGTAILLVSLNPTKDEALAMIEELNAAYEALERSKVTMQEGYYWIQSGCQDFQDTKALKADFDDDLQWATFDAEDATQLFRLVEDDSKWKLQNVATGQYVGQADTKSLRLAMDNEGTAFDLNSVGDGMHSIIGKGGSIALETVRDNTMAQGFVTLYNPAQPSYAAWNLAPVTDEAQVSQLNHNASVVSTLQSAMDAYSLALGCGSRELLTKGSQLYANSVMSGFPVSNLLDKGTAYDRVIFHSIWGAGALPAGVNNYLQVNLEQPQQFVRFTTVGSSWSGTYDTPDHYVIMATDTPEDESTWKAVAELHDMIPEVLHTTYPAFYTSPLIDLGAAYTHLRFVVISTVNNRSNGNGNIYFSLARFQVFGNATDSKYYTTEGLAPAVDDMMALRQELSDLAPSQVTPDQVAELQQKVAIVLAILNGGTGIQGVDATSSLTAPIYDLLGRKAIRSAKPSIYIKEGKKVLVR